MPMEKKEIKVKIDARTYDKALEYNINIEEFLSTELRIRVNEISHELARAKAYKEHREYEQEQFIIKIIKKMSRTSKFDYASKDSIIAEAEIELISKEEVVKILDKLEEKKDIYQPIKSNYKVTKIKQK